MFRSAQSRATGHLHAHGFAGSLLMTQKKADQFDTQHWQMVQELFEQCQSRPRTQWYAHLCAPCKGRERVAFDVLSLLVTAEGLPAPADGDAPREVEPVSTTH